MVKQIKIIRKTISPYDTDFEKFQDLVNDEMYILKEMDPKIVGYTDSIFNIHEKVHVLSCMIEYCK
jgi:hypothetical protein